MKNRTNVRWLTQLALLVAILLVLNYTPLGYLQIGPLSASLLTVPVAIGAMTMNPMAGAILGGVFGATSFIQAVEGKSAMGAALFQVSPAGTFVVCFVARVLMGLCTALIFNGELIPNTELGHLELLKGKGDAEKYAASSIREKLDMGYKKWAKRLTKYYSLMEFYLDPQLFVVGGGVSRVSEKFLPYIDIKTPIVAAKLHNEAGIIGAAYYASTKQK